MFLRSKLGIFASLEAQPGNAAPYLLEKYALASNFTVFTIIAINFCAVKIDFFESTDEIYRWGKTTNGGVLPRIYERLFTSLVAIFDMLKLF